MIGDNFETEEFDTFSFYYTPVGEPEREAEAHVEAAWDAPWTVPLGHFLDFLGEVYGYDIKDQVAVKFNPFREAAGWTGPTFGDVIRTDAPKQLELFPKED
jgi:hypothetical protein